jgi:hypothetical protein
MDKKQRFAIAFVAVVGVITSINGQCDLGLAVDPPPLECGSVEDGQSLAVEATLAGMTLTIEITHVDGNARWEEDSVAITRPVNVVADASPSVGRDLVSVSVRLTSEKVTSGGLTFSGTLSNSVGTSCEVTRDFTFTVDGTSVTIE